MKLYSLFDKIGNKHLSITLADSDADFVRSSLYAILMDYPIQDVQAYCVGTFYEDSGIIIPCSPRLVDWNCYKFPKSADSLEENYLTIEELRQSALAKKKKFDELTKDKIDDLKKMADDVTNALKNPDLTDKQKVDLENYLSDINNRIKSMEVA